MPALSHSASSSSPSVGSALRHATRQMASRKSSKPRWVRFTRDLLSFSESCERYAKGARSRHNQRHNQTDNNQTAIRDTIRDTIREPESSRVGWGAMRWVSRLRRMARSVATGARVEWSVARRARVCAVGVRRWPYNDM